MNIPWWECVLVFVGAFFFVLVWVVRNINYDNLVKWRGIIRREGNWQWWAILGLLTLVVIIAYSVYRLIVEII